METLQLTEELIASELSDFFGPEDVIKYNGNHPNTGYMSITVRLANKRTATLIPLNWNVTSIDFFKGEIRMHRRR